MKDMIKNFIIAISLAVVPFLIILWCIHLDDQSYLQKTAPYEKFKPFSIPIDSTLYKEWEDHFDTVFVKEGITYYQQKDGQFQ